MSTAIDTTATPAVIPNPGFHLSSYTVYDRRGQSSGSYAVHLCDDCAAIRRANGTMASKWSGECVNGYCDDCKAGPSVSHFRFAVEPLTTSLMLDNHETIVTHASATDRDEYLRANHDAHIILTLPAAPTPSPAIPTQEPAPQTPTIAGRQAPLFDKQITYDRESRDYRMELDGELVGFARSYHTAEVALDQLVFELITSGATRTATELDAPVDYDNEPAAMLSILGPITDAPVGAMSCDICHVAPAAVQIEDYRLCAGCNAAATDRLHRAVRGPHCLVCEEPTEQAQSLCEACQEQGRPWPAPAAPAAPTGLIPVAQLHDWARTDIPRYRAALAGLTPHQLDWQAPLYAAYASIVNDRHMSTEEAMEHFRRSIAVHRSGAERQTDDQSAMLYELALTDPAALRAFLAVHSAYQRERLAWRFAGWLRGRGIERTPQYIAGNWDRLIGEEPQVAA